jgi:hypothetical protein
MGMAGLAELALQHNHSHLLLVRGALHPQIRRRAVIHGQLVAPALRSSLQAFALPAS